MILSMSTSALRIPTCGGPFNSSPPQVHLRRSLSSYTRRIPNNLNLISAPTKRLLCRPPQGKHVREDYLVKNLSAAELQELIKGDRNVPLVIDFYATWCGPCILMAQQLEMVRGLPTLYFVSPDPNKDAIRTEGLIPIQMMRDIIDTDM